MQTRIVKDIHLVVLIVLSAFGYSTSFAECDWLNPPTFKWFYSDQDNSDMPPGLSISYPACSAERYDVASANCRKVNARVCKYEDLFAVYYFTSWDGAFNPNGKWIGNMVDDDRVFCGNKDITGNGDPDANNFEGKCNKADKRQYYCCYGP